MTERLLGCLEGDSMARLRHLVLKRLGVCPLSLRARLAGDRRIIACACQLVLDMERKQTGSFDMERFLEMKEGSREEL